MGKIVESKKKVIISMITKDKDLLLWFQRWLDSKRCHCYHCNKDKIPSSFYYLKKVGCIHKGDYLFAKNVSMKCIITTSVNIMTIIRL